MVVSFVSTMWFNKEFNDVMGLNIWLGISVVIGSVLWVMAALKARRQPSAGNILGEKQTQWIDKNLREEKEWIDTGFSAIFMATFIMYFIVQAFKIPSGSMRSTLMEGDHLFVNKFIYGLRIPLTDKKIARFKKVKHDDIIVFRFPSEDKKSEHYGKDFIKRAIGLPGDIIEIKDKAVYRNGQLLDEAFTQHIDARSFRRIPVFITQEEYQRAWEKGKFAGISGDMVRDNFGPITVPEGYYFAMGDNRDASYDSRFWGPLPDTYLKGKAWILYWPLKRIKIIR
jgi:signal peptidase I